MVVNAFAMKRPDDPMAMPSPARALPVQNSFVNRTAPAPPPVTQNAMRAAPVAAPAKTVNPFAMAQAPKPSLAGNAFKAFASGILGNDRVKAIDAEYKAAGQDKIKQTLALMQQQRALPTEQRGQWWMQNAPVISEIIGQDVGSMQVDEAQFSDQALDGHIAALSAQMGMAPAASEGPMEINNQLVDPRTGKVMGDYRTPEKPMAVNNRLVNPETGDVIADYSDPTMPKTFNTGQAIVSIDPATNKPTVLYRDEQRPSGSSARLRPATPQEAERYGPPGTMGQIDDTTGRFYPTARPNPQTGGLATEGERKFGLYAKTARDALVDIEKIEFGKGIEADPTFDRGGELNPFNGTARKYDQAIDRFLDGWSRAMTGAAMTNDEKQFYYGIMKPTFGDDPSVRKQKAAERRAMVERLKTAAARGYEEPQPELIMDDAEGDDETFIDNLFQGVTSVMSTQAPVGVDPEDWQFMTPEQKALFQ